MTKKLNVISSSSMVVDPAPTPPQLGQDGAKLWHRVTSEYDMSDAAGFEMLKQVCGGKLMTLPGIARSLPGTAR